MHKLGELIQQISGVDEAYAQLLADEDVKDVLFRYESLLNIGELPSFATTLDEYASGKKKCVGCIGIDNCSQPIKGHFPTVTPHLGRASLTYAPCEYYKSRQHLAHIENFHMPKSMEHASFKTLYADVIERKMLISHAADFVQNYKVGDFKKGLFLHGSMGSGKTYAICAIANELAKKGIGCAIVYFPELIAGIKASFNGDNNENDMTVEKLKDVPILMLDDIGSESVTSWMRDEVLGRILNHRMMHELPTFFTSNFNFEQLQTHYAQTTRNEYEPVKAARILERIKALAISVELVGRNYRDEL